MKKTCFKCGKTKSIDEFYEHKQMADGHINKCKDCTKGDVRERYYSPDGRKKIIAYEKKRAKDIERKRKMVVYQQGRRQRRPGVDKARHAVNNALRDKRLIKKPCAVCGDKNTEAHHKDYRKYLDVIWLCRKHHLEVEGKKLY